MYPPQKATARLRRTFRYPAEDEDSDPDAMDEQEQEAFISNLSAENANRNNQFRIILFSLTLLSTIPYLPLLLARARMRLLSLLSLTCLLSTAWLLHRLPPHATGVELLDRWVGRQRRGGVDGQRTGSTAAAAAVGAGLSRSGTPLEIWLPYMNLGLGLTVLLLGRMMGEETAKVGWVGLGDLPLLVYGAVQGAKAVMGTVDPETELARLKYNYRGA